MSRSPVALCNSFAPTGDILRNPDGGGLEEAKGISLAPFQGFCPDLRRWFLDREGCDPEENMLTGSDVANLDRWVESEG